MNNLTPDKCDICGDPNHNTSQHLQWIGYGWYPITLDPLTSWLAVLAIAAVTLIILYLVSYR